MSEVYIRSQNKKGLFIINNANGIICGEKEGVYFKSSPTEPEEKEKYCIYLQGNGTQNTLGEYASKERCIEILDEIQKVCGSYLYAQGNSGLLRGTEATPPVAFTIPRLYQMPEE